MVREEEGEQGRGGKGEGRRNEGSFYPLPLHPPTHPPSTAQKALFFVGKLRVKVLPSLIFFVDGVAVGRQTGFEGLLPVAALRSVSRGGSSAAAAVVEDFPTSALWRALKASGVLGAALRERAESDSGEEEGGEGGEEEEGGGGAGSRYRAAAARLTAAEAAELAPPQPQPQVSEKQREEALGAAIARWGREEGE